MKIRPSTALLPVVLAVVAAGTPADAQNVRLNGEDGDSVARVIPRVAAGDASLGIVTREGRATLLLRDTTIVLQFTDDGLEHATRLGRERGEDEGGDATLVRALLAAMIGGGLRVLLDHGIEYSLRDLAAARFESGRLVLVSVRGGEVFSGVEIDDRPLMESFLERDARAFAEKVNRARKKLERR